VINYLSCYSSVGATPHATVTLLRQPFVRRTTNIGQYISDSFDKCVNNEELSQILAQYVVVSRALVKDQTKNVKVFALCQDIFSELLVITDLYLCISK
jgi:hypothetical protein